MTMKRMNMFMYAMSILFAVLAVVGGGVMAMAMAVGTTGSDTDPNEGKPLEGAHDDEPGKGIEQPGGAGTGSGVKDADLELTQLNDYVAKFQAHKFPMHTDVMKLAKQFAVDTKTPSYFEIGEAVLDFKTKTAYTGLDASNSAAYDETINLASYLYKVDKRHFSINSTILVRGVDGYNSQGVKDGQSLVLYVVGSGISGIEVAPLNGPINASDGKMYIPAIPAGTSLQIMATALSESQVEVSPDAAYPKETEVYLQRKGCAITCTELFNRMKKKAKWSEQDLKDYTLATFRKKCTRTMLIGTKSVQTIQNEKTGTEYAYTQEGILRQLRLGYQINGAWTVGDLISISKMVFGKFATSYEMDVYAGPDAMEKIANIDFSEHPEIVMEQKLSEVGIGMSSLRTPFGVLNFKLEHALEDIGMSEYAVVMNVKDALHLYYDQNKVYRADHTKGEGGEVRAAKSEYYIQDDCVVIRSYNSMLIGPNIAVTGLSNIDATVVAHSSANALPASPSASNIYYFTVDVTASNVTYPQGLWVYENSQFVPYLGEIHG